MSYPDTYYANQDPLFVRSEGPIIEPNPHIEWASGAVFNPGAWYDGHSVHLLLRGIPVGYSPIGKEKGFDDYVSVIGYANSRDGVRFSLREDPFLKPDASYDIFGAEDPRISCLDDLYLVTYTALSRPAFASVDGVRIGLASTKDFNSVEKHGVIGPPVFDKDAVIFPSRIGGRAAMLDRIEPDIQIIYFDDLSQLMNPPSSLWDEHMSSLDLHTVMKPETEWESEKIGAGPTPIETSEGWLLIYHGVDRFHVYRAGLALLDLDDPKKVIARTRRPVLWPETEYERVGDVNNVVFPEGAALIGDTLHLYYGAADTRIGHATAKLSDVLKHVRKN